jgi:hypothetical protein
MDDLLHELGRGHERLEQLLKRLSEDVLSSDPRNLQETWSEFETCLTRHLQLEERCLLPSIMASQPDEVRSTLTEHRRIRECVADLGVDIDLPEGDHPARDRQRKGERGGVAPGEHALVSLAIGERPSVSPNR